MSDQAYVPRTVDTSNVVLPRTLIDLVERLSENTHEVWAAERLAAGWRHGPTRDDAALTHPCLVPYRDLPEAEKAYDRKVTSELLKCVLAFGFRIEAISSATA